MPNTVEFVRRITTFLLAAFLWSHALFLLNIQVPLVAKLSNVARLNSSETILFVLLFLFSAISASGFWKTVRSLAYIYFFPFVLVAYSFVVLFLVIRAVNRWFMRDQKATASEQVTPEESPDEVIEISVPQSQVVVPQPQAIAGAPLTVRASEASVASTLMRPFKRFTLLWCILLLLSTHKVITWLSLAVVLCHLVWKIVGVLKITLFSRTYIEKVGGSFFVRLDQMLEQLRSVNPRTRLSKELEQLWKQLDLWVKVARFLQNKYLVSRWAGVLVTTFFLCVYIYIAVLFSFVYFGIGKVSGLTYGWSEAFITSLFIPAYIEDLPKTLAMRTVGGLQFTLIFCVGLGTFLNYLHRRIESVHSGAVLVSARLGDIDVQQRLAILERKVNAKKKSPAKPATP
jgi:hypothetical protein